MDYYAHGRHIARHDPPRKFDLLRITNPHSVPILPVLSDAKTEVLASSPILPFLRPERANIIDSGIGLGVASASMSDQSLTTLVAEASESEAMSQLVNPHGPWTIHGKMKLPSCSSRLHFTNKQAKGVIDVRHWLKMCLRVDKGDESDSKGKRRLYDIMIETPVHILAVSVCSFPSPSPVAYLNSYIV